MSTKLEFRRTRSHLITYIVFGIVAVAILAYISFNIIKGGGGEFIFPVGIGAYIVYRLVRAVKELRENQVYLAFDETGASIKGKYRVAWNAVKSVSFVTETRNGVTTSNGLRFRMIDGGSKDVSTSGIPIDQEEILSIAGTYVAAFSPNSGSGAVFRRRPAADPMASPSG